MRPSMRLPLREALYVCSNCRAEVTPRGIYPLTRQFRRHASSKSPSLLERARRALWKGDKPPGPEDPYSGGSQLAREMRWRTKPSDTDDVNPRSLRPVPLGEEEGVQLSAGDPYVQAETWDGLEHIGFTKDEEWLGQPITKADRYMRYGGNLRTRPLPDAAHQIAVEIALLQLLGKPPGSISTLFNHYGPVTKMLDTCIVGGSETQQWNTTLRFPDQKTMDVLLYVFKQIGENTESKEIEAPETLLVKKKRSDKQGHRALSIVDPAVKFAYFKRLSLLTGRRIPDNIVSSSATINEAFLGLEAMQKQKPKDVGKKLEQRRKAGRLPPNIFATSTRLSKGDDDEALGRKKTIHAELYSRGLVLPKKSKKVAA